MNNATIKTMSGKYGDMPMILGVIIVSAIIFLCTWGISGNEDLAGKVGVVFMLVSGAIARNVLRARRGDGGKRGMLEKELAVSEQFIEFLKSDEARQKYSEHDRKTLLNSFEKYRIMISGKLGKGVVFRGRDWKV